MKRLPNAHSVLLSRTPRTFPELLSTNNSEQSAHEVEMRGELNNGGETK